MNQARARRVHDGVVASYLHSLTTDRSFHDPQPFASTCSGSRPSR